MKFRLPPKHRVDAPIVFIHPADEAWDQDAVAKSEEEHGKECPFLQYCTGETRCDPSDAQHLLKGQPVEYHLSRLSALQLNEVQSLIERDITQGGPMTRTGYLQAARYGLKELKQGGAELVALQSPGNLSMADIELLRDATPLGIDLIRQIGAAVYQASQPLREDEKKPSGS